MASHSTRTVGALAPPLILLCVGAAVSSETVAGLVNAAAVIYLAVFALEAVLRQRRSAAAHHLQVENYDAHVAALELKLRDIQEHAAIREVRSAEDQLSRQLVKVLTFAANSTPGVAVDTRTKNPDALNGWLDVISVRLTQATRISAGAMVAREEFTIDDEELEPFCEIRYSGGAHQCTLPVGSRVPIKAGVAWDIAQGVGARSIFLAKTSLNDHRYWICLTFVAEVDHPLLQSLSRIVVAPVTIALQHLESGELPEERTTHRGTDTPTHSARED